jgi:hypothetical protein
VPTEACLQSLCSAGIGLQQAWTLTTTVLQFTLGHVIKVQAAPPLEEVRRYSRDALTDAYPLLAAATEGVLATQHTEADG